MTHKKKSIVYDALEGILKAGHPRRFAGRKAPTPDFASPEEVEEAFIIFSAVLRRKSTPKN